MLKVYFDLMSQPSRAVYLFLNKTRIPHEKCKVDLAQGQLFNIVLYLNPILRTIYLQFIFCGRQVSLIYGRGTRVPRGALLLCFQLQLGLVWDLPLIAPTFLFSIFHTTPLICFFLLFHPCRSHGRGTFRGIHTSCMHGIPVPLLHSKCSSISVFCNVFGAIKD